MLAPEWITVIAVVGGQLGTMALTIDRWVHAQDGQQVDVKGRLEAMDRTVDATNERWSKELSRMQTHVTEMELDLREALKELTRLTTIDEERRRRGL